MRINVYSQELILDGPLVAVEAESKPSNTGIVYSCVRLFLHSSDRLHHPPEDDDRSAVTFWLPKSADKRERTAVLFEKLAEAVRACPAETGLD